MRTNRSRLLNFSRLDKHIQTSPRDEQILLAGVAFAHNLLHARADLLNVSRLEKVLVGPWVEAWVSEAHGKHVRHLPSFVVRVSNDPLKDTLAPVFISICHCVAAQLDEKVIHGDRILLDVLDEVDLQDVDQ